jgi:hypothetical protein
MPDSIKRIEERQILATFLWASRLHAEILREGEAPDFTLSIDGRTVGVEVTQIQKSPAERTRQSYLQEVIRRAREDYAAAGALPRSVSLHFNDHAPRAGDSRRDLASEISAHVAGQPDDAEVHTHKWPQLPELMARNLWSLTFWRTEAPVIWQSVEATWVAPFTVELFQERVDAKHEKLETYREGGFDELWLLIGASQLNPAQRFDWHASFDPGKIRSRFDRTVFCDGWRTFELGQGSTGHG